MKDDKPVKKMVPRDVDDLAVPVPAPMVTEYKAEASGEPFFIHPEPAAEATLPVGTHFDNLKKNRRA